MINSLKYRVNVTSNLQWKIFEIFEISFINWPYTNGSIRGQRNESYMSKLTFFFYHKTGHRKYVDIKEQVNFGVFFYAIFGELMNFSHGCACREINISSWHFFEVLKSFNLQNSMSIISISLVILASALPSCRLFSSAGENIYVIGKVQKCFFHEPAGRERQ